MHVCSFFYMHVFMCLCMYAGAHACSYLYDVLHAARASTYITYVQCILIHYIHANLQIVLLARIHADVHANMHQQICQRTHTHTSSADICRNAQAHIQDGVQVLAPLFLRGSRKRQRCCMHVADRIQQYKTRGIVMCVVS